MELNYLGTISVTQHVLQHMMHHGDGIIATVSSIVGLVGAPLSTGYVASKHALQVRETRTCGEKNRKWLCVMIPVLFSLKGFFKALRTELTDYPNITISTICPGPVVSQIVHNAFTEKVDKVHTPTPTECKIMGHFLMM